MKTEDFPKETNSPPYKNMFLEGRDKGGKKPASGRQWEGKSRTSTVLCPRPATDRYTNFVFRLSLEMKLILAICILTYEWDGIQTI